ncbi:MAG: sulfoxide reductase heme-binding subunit YedZ [Anaerolineae bacterium]|nr:sulfoxide reductase heme-binding subunit YedZ [Anaerolineae bacterium]
MGQQLKDNWLRIAAHVASLAPLVLIVWDLAGGALVVDPVRELTTRTGRAAIALLIASLACTPVHSVFGFKRVMRIRKVLGLYAFLYTTLHFLIFAAWDYGLDFALLWRAIAFQLYVVVGFAAFVILFVLAAISTRQWQKRLGKTWGRIQQAVYLANILAVVHVLWLSKAPDKAIRYGVIIGILLFLRIPPVKKAIVKARKKIVKPAR